MMISIFKAESALGYLNTPVILLYSYIIILLVWLFIIPKTLQDDRTCGHFKHNQNVIKQNSVPFPIPPKV